VKAGNEQRDRRSNIGGVPLNQYELEISIAK